MNNKMLSEALKAKVRAKETDQMMEDEDMEYEDEEKALKSMVSGICSADGKKKDAKISSMISYLEGMKSS